MAKATVHVTAHYTIEVDLDRVKEIYGKVNKHSIEEEAWESIPVNAPYLTECVIEEIEGPEPVKKTKVRRGVGSY